MMQDRPFRLKTAVAFVRSGVLAQLRGQRHPRPAPIHSAVRRVSAANFVEAAVIIDASRDPVASRRFDDLIKEAQIIIEPVTELQARIARDAYRDFGKGSSHPAKLNFGDCFAYALRVAGGVADKSSPSLIVG
jgi:uncharacterized protein with PIN domain